MNEEYIESKSIVIQNNIERELSEYDGEHLDLCKSIVEQAMSPGFLKENINILEAIYKAKLPDYNFIDTILDLALKFDTPTRVSVTVLNSYFKRSLRMFSLEIMSKVITAKFNNEFDNYRKSMLMKTGEEIFNESLKIAAYTSIRNQIYNYLDDEVDEEDDDNSINDTVENTFLFMLDNDDVILLDYLWKNMKSEIDIVPIEWVYQDLEKIKRSV